MKHGIAYYTTQVSPNIGATPEGFLIAHDCTIGRTGFQKYKGEELIKQHGADALKELGLDIHPGQDVDVYRPAEQVFSEDALASFEGKPVCDGHPDNGEFVSPDNIARYQKGHIQSVRQGKEPLDDGNYPVIADVIATHPELISKIKNGERELSCGYSYDLVHDKKSGHVLQTNIIGNHLALVPKGRAGAAAHINDAQPVLKEKVVSNSNGRKEKKPVNNLLKHVFGLGLKAFAADADPEELAKAAKEAEKLEDKPKIPPAIDSAHSPDCSCSTCAEKKANDGHRVDDYRGRMHKALDRVLASGRKRTDDRKTGDIDLDKLRALLDQFLKEEGGEAEHAEGAEESTREVSDDPDAPPNPGEEEMPPEAIAADESKGGFEQEMTFAQGAEGKNPGKSPGSAKDRSKARDRSRAADALVPTFSANRGSGQSTDGDFMDGAKFVLNAFRPFVAKEKNVRMMRAFDTISTGLGRAARRDGNGSYAGVGAASDARSEEARRSMTTGRAADGSPLTRADQVTELNKVMRERFRKQPVVN